MLKIDMSGYRRVSYYELCRLCTSSEGTKLHIFREEGKRRQLSTKIQMCLPLQISEDDSLPKIICKNCADKLEDYFDFRSSCVNAEAMLEGYFTSLRYNNNDFTKEGKVYVKESLSKNQDPESLKRIELGPTQIPQEIHMPIPTSSQIKEASSQPQAVTSVPVTLDSLSNLVQAAAIQIVSQNDSDPARLQQYKCQGQSQPVQTVDSSSDNRFTFQSCNDTNGPAQAQQTTQPTFIANKSTKEKEARVDEESSEDEENETSLQPTIAFPSSSTDQDVLVHYGFNKEKETVSSSEVFRTEESINRSPVVQIGEFLQMKTVDLEGVDDGRVEGEPIPCEQCGRELSPDERDSHALTCSASNSSEDKPNGTYLCDICNKPFKRKEHLFQHKKLHTGERPYPCGRCGKAFSRKEHLVRHSVSHTGQKQYSCDICGKSFGRKDNVRKHRKTHGLSGPFVCETCGKTFVVKPYYLMHKSSHCTGSGAGESAENFPYRCDICNKGFSVKQYLNTHKLRHRNRNQSTIEPSDIATTEQAVLHQGQVFQVATTTPTAYICTTTATNQLLETYRKLNPT